ncbi:MAG: aminoacyl-tRNA hydrolase [Candidatus Omnitrophota bacterium]
MKLIIGLGNPGASYKATRHNAGAMAVERLAKKEKLFFKANRSFKSYIATGKINNEPVCLALPQTFMNLSGEAVEALVKKRRITHHDVLIVYDDVNLLLGQIKAKPKGSDGGHHGLASVIEKLADSNIPRLRFGIGCQGLRGDLTDYVLSRFDKEEAGIVESILEKASEAIKAWALEGMDKCMNVCNTLTKR